MRKWYVIDFIHVELNITKKNLFSGGDTKIITRGEKKEELTNLKNILDYLIKEGMITTKKEIMISNNKPSPMTVFNINPDWTYYKEPKVHGSFP